MRCSCFFFSRFLASGPFSVPAAWGAARGVPARKPAKRRKPFPISKLDPPPFLLPGRAPCGIMARVFALRFFHFGLLGIVPFSESHSTFSAFIQSNMAYMEIICIFFTIFHCFESLLSVSTIFQYYEIFLSFFRFAYFFFNIYGMIVSGSSFILF